MTTDIWSRHRHPKVLITRQEAAAILSPVMTVRQVEILIVIAGIAPIGTARTGRTGRPPYLYDRDAITEAHDTEAARTAKQFIDNDWIGSALLDRGLITADPDAGTLRWPDGTRAETVMPGIYGAVRVGRACVMAHRIIWIATEGEIPFGIEINHCNHRRWDNRRANLELVTHVENIHHGHGMPYLTQSDAAAELAELAVLPQTLPAPDESLVRAGGAFRRRF